MPSARFHFERLLRIILWRREHKGAGVNRNLVAIRAQHLVERHARLSRSDIVEADIERSIGINRYVIPPAIVGPESPASVFRAASGSLPRKNGFKAEAATAPAISAPRPAKPNECPSIPSSVFIVITRKSKVDLPPDRISESDIAGRVFWQTRISIEVIRTSSSRLRVLVVKFLNVRRTRRKSSESDGQRQLNQVSAHETALKVLVLP